jgi:hypothetical protein
MLIKDLDGNSHNWQLTGNMSKGKISNKSSLHLSTRSLLIKYYPTLQNETLYLDFYLPLNKTCIEVHGEQHYKFIPFYHSNVLTFLKSQKRDRQKQEWCELNNIRYIALPYNENEQEWIERIQNA